MRKLSNQEVIRERRHRYHTFARAYDGAASSVSDRGRRLAVVTASLSALVSSAIFTSLNAGEVNVQWRWITGGVSLLATVLAAAVAAINHGDLATEYRKAALKCVELQHRAEELIAREQVTDEELATFDKAASEAEGVMTVVPESHFRRAEEYCDSHREGDPFERI